MYTPMRIFPTLETSLVEWKRETNRPIPLDARGLGNFLSGMETALQKCEAAGVPSLGNFLSGMETHRGEGGVIMILDLGNFLSGMETQGFAQRGQTP